MLSTALLARRGMATRSYPLRAAATTATRSPAVGRSSHGRSLARRWLVAGSLLSTAGSLYYVDKKVKQHHPHFAELCFSEKLLHARRFLRTTYVMAVVSWDYKHSLRNYQYGTPEYAAVRSEVHQRTANRLLELCRKHAGVFIKAGQHIASMNHVLPREYTQTLAVLQDQAPNKPFEEIVEVFKEQLGRHPDELYSFFERKPIASASLAQVHRARLHDGQDVAVKVQYSDFERLTSGDLLAIDVAARTIAWLFPDFQFGWIVPEFRRNLAMEIDFTNEGKNAERIAKNFSHERQLAVPRIFWPLTAKKVLTMEFMHGVKVTDLKGLEQLGVDKTEVARLLHCLFCEQIYEHGFIHSDPHPGNILIRRMDGRPLPSFSFPALNANNETSSPSAITLPLPKGKPQVVLLDHGLYRELTNQFRLDYCKLWQALIKRDKKKIEKYCRRMGAGDFHELFTVILTFRPLDTTANSGVSLHLKDEQMDKAQLRLIRAQMRERNARLVFSELMQNIDRQLLLVLRTNNLIRSIIQDLGATSSVDRFTIMARYSFYGIHGRFSDQSLWQRIRRTGSSAWLEAHLLLYKLVFQVWRTCSRFLSLFVKL